VSSEAQVALIVGIITSVTALVGALGATIGDDVHDSAD